MSKDDGRRGLKSTTWSGRSQLIMKVTVEAWRMKEATFWANVEARRAGRAQHLDPPFGTKCIELLLVLVMFSYALSHEFNFFDQGVEEIRRPDLNGPSIQNERQNLFASALDVQILHCLP